MIQEYINNIKESQKEEYVTRYDILNNSLTKSEITEIGKRGGLSNADFSKVRSYVLGLEGEESNSSFEEGILNGLEDFEKTLKLSIKKHIRITEKYREVSEDFILGMKEVLEFIK